MQSKPPNVQTSKSPKLLVAPWTRWRLGAAPPSSTFGRFDVLTFRAFSLPASQPQFRAREKLVAVRAAMLLGDDLERVERIGIEELDAVDLRAAAADARIDGIQLVEARQQVALIDLELAR